MVSASEERWDKLKKERTTLKGTITRRRNDLDKAVGQQGSKRKIRTMVETLESLLDQMRHLTVELLKLKEDEEEGMLVAEYNEKVREVTFDVMDRAKESLELRLAAGEASSVVTVSGASKRGDKLKEGTELAGDKKLIKELTKNKEK